MSLPTLYPLISAIFVFILGVLVLLRNPRNRLNFTFALHALVISLWLFGTFMMFLNRDDITSAIYWDRFIYGSVVFIPAFMYHFCLALTNRKANFWLFSAYFLSIFFLIVSQTDYFVADAFYYKWGVHTKARLFHHFFLAYFSFYVVFWFFEVYKYYKKVDSALLKYQIKYFFIAFLVLFTIGPTAYLPAYGISIYPFSYLSGLIFTIIISYAILKYRLMDMRVIVRWFVIYGIDSVFVYLFYSVIIIIYPYLWGSIYSNYTILAGIVVAPLFVFFMFGFHRLFSNFVNKYFFYSLYDYQKTISGLTRELNYYNDLDKIINLIVSTIKKTMGLNRAGVLLAENDGSVVNYRIAKVTGFNITNGISLVQDSFFTKYLKQISKPLVREELFLLARDAKTDKEKKSLLSLEKEMHHIEASLCLPLLKSGKLMGIIVLGSKSSGDPYTEEDLNLLSTLSLQAAVAIDNARLYQETKNFNKVLQKKVDEQTQELLHRAEHLQKLLEMRSEFLDIASHQLKTPVSVIKGTISMFRDGSMDKLPEVEKKKFFDNIYHKAEKLNVIIGDILRASEVDTEEFKIDPLTAKPDKMEDILKSIYEDLKDLAINKGLKLNLVLPPKKLPPVMTSADFLEQALYNLVDNAIKYTAKGSVTLSLKQDGDYLVVEVADTGIGIPQADKDKMFDKFSRAKNAVDMYADGSGLGLFIVKRIIEAHDDSSVTFNSQEGQGTTFIVRMKTADKLAGRVNRRTNPKS